MRGASAPRVGLPAVRITTATTTAVKTGGGSVHQVIIEAALTGTATLNDGLGTKVLLPIGFPAGSYQLDIAFATKIEVVTSAADKLVVVYE